MFAELLLTTGIVLITYAIYVLSTRGARYFEERNLKYDGVITGIRRFFDFFFGKTDVFTFSQNCYNEFPDQPIFGLFDFALRNYFVRDPDTFKRIAIRDFDHFEDRRGFVTEETDELWGKGLMSLHGEKWRDMRATLSPAFTGSKMRQMFELVSECADEVVQFYLSKAKNGEKIDIEMKDFFSRYSTDVIATCAFGIKVNSSAEPNNEFYRDGKKMVDFSGQGNGFKMFMGFMFPKIARFFNIKLFDQTVTNSFKRMILDTMKIRKEQNIFRPDMINILMQAREGSLKYQTEEKEKSKDGFATVEESDVGKKTVTRIWSDDDLVAQCLLFFLAGFEPTSTTLMFAAHELMANPDVQQKLYEEIAEVNEKCGGKRVTYDEIQKMKYLDQVISETVRKWPTGVQIDRICVKDYMFDDGDKLKFKIEKGSVISFSLYAIHHDPKYFPNPDKFDPERFSDENKQNIKPGTFVAFGVGPRNCIGSRFALMELKVIVYYLLLNFSFEPNKDSQIPLRMKKVTFVLTEKGVHLELRPRKKNKPKLTKKQCSNHILQYSMTIK